MEIGIRCGNQMIGINSLTQIINLSEEGTVRIDKCGHWVSRALGGEIQKDGVVQ